MKKLLCILLCALVLCGTMGVGLTAAAAPVQAAGIVTDLLLKPLTDFIAQYDLANLTRAQADLLAGILGTLKALGIDYTAILEPILALLPAWVKDLLAAAGLLDGGGTLAANPLKPLLDFLAGVDLENLTEAQLNLLIATLNGLKLLGIDYKPALDALRPILPFAVKAALHDAGLMEYPIWERDFMWYLIVRYLLFGWLWMDMI